MDERPREWAKLRLPFSMVEYDRRMRNLREKMAEQHIDVMIVNSPRNLYYLTGNRTFTAWTSLSCYQNLIVWEGDPIYVVRFYEEPSVRGSSWVKDYVTYRDTGPIHPYDPVGTVAEVLKDKRLERKKIAFETDFISHEEYQRFGELLPHAEFRNGTRIVDHLRLLKSEEEIERIRKACEINDRVLMATIDRLSVGVTENEMVTYAQRLYLEEGSEMGPILPFVNFGIVNFGSPQAHLLAFGKKSEGLNKGDLVLFEFGAFVDKYAGACARNMSMGKPSDRVLQVAESIISGLTKGIEALRPGVTAGEIHRIVRGEVAKAGYGEDFRRRAGYSIGIDWYNGDTLSIREGEPTVLKPGMTFHLNPDCLVPGVGTVMASETVLVTEDGHEVLGKTERRLFVK